MSYRQRDASGRIGLAALGRHMQVMIIRTCVQSYGLILKNTPIFLQKLPLVAKNDGLVVGPGALHTVYLAVSVSATRRTPGFLLSAVCNADNQHMDPGS